MGGHGAGDERADHGGRGNDEHRRGEQGGNRTMHSFFLCRLLVVSDRAPATPWRCRISNAVCGPVSYTSVAASKELERTIRVTLEVSERGSLPISYRCLCLLLTAPYSGHSLRRRTMGPVPEDGTGCDRGTTIGLGEDHRWQRLI